jgi:hypothetical protein
MPTPSAVDLIVAGKGTLFDPAEVDAFLQVFPSLTTAPPSAAMPNDISNHSMHA